MNGLNNLPNDPIKLKAMVGELYKENVLLREENRLLKHYRFATKSETVNPDQLPLLTHNPADYQKELKAMDQSIQVKSHKRKKKYRLGFGDNLPVETVILDLPEDQKTCGCCQNPLKPIGSESTKKIEYVPASLKVIDYQRLKYTCTHCQSVPARAELPKFILPKSFATPSLLAFIFVSKFADHLPYHRIEQMLKRHNIYIPRQTMSAWGIALSEKIKPLLQVMEKMILSGPRIWTDDTILPLQNDIPNRNKVIQARLWVYIGGKTHDPPLVLYEYSRTRGQQWPMQKLESFEGYLQADCYKVYVTLNDKGKLKHVACLTHARRKFYEASLAMKHSGRAMVALYYIKEVYRIEHECEDMNDDDRKAYRLQYAKPILDEFKAWADDQVNALVTEKGLLGRALRYTIKHWDSLIRYLEAGYLKPDNNTSEHNMTNVALGRKNWIFAGSDRGGEAIAGFYSLIQSCKPRNINPMEYFIDIFTRLPTCKTEEDYRALIPGYWEKQ